MGDATTNIGAFHESLNLAALWKLPVVYAVVNNGFGMGTSVEAGSSVVALHVSADVGKGSVDVDVENTSPHPSIMSATANWVEVEIPSGGIREVQTGGFDRFEVFGADRNPVTLGRATAVRFYETLVGGHERSTGGILPRGAPRDRCTVHCVLASGRPPSAGADAK
jgi:hypothetical protein